MKKTTTILNNRGNLIKLIENYLSTRNTLTRITVFSNAEAVKDFGSKLVFEV